MATIYTLKPAFQSLLRLPDPVVSESHVGDVLAKIE